jgi:hypothetical protein
LALQPRHPANRRSCWDSCQKAYRFAGIAAEQNCSALMEWFTVGGERAGHTTDI